MRLLTFMQMAETQKEIPFSVIESELQIKPEEVESFIIEGNYKSIPFAELKNFIKKKKYK